MRWRGGLWWVSYTVKLRYLELDGTVWKLRDNRVPGMWDIKGKIHIHFIQDISVQDNKVQDNKVQLYIWHTQGYD